MAPFLEDTSMWAHGITFGGHPVMCAIALKNIEIMKRERIVEHVRDTESDFRATLAQLLDLPIVGDLRGTGFFYALELVKDKETRETFTDEECESLLRGFLSPRLFERGLICRADDRGDPVVQISPPLVATQAEFDEIDTHPRRRAHRGLERARTHQRPLGLRSPSPAVWAALALLAWSVVAIVVDAKAAPPPSVLVVVLLAAGLGAAHNRRMRTTGRLLLVLLAFVYVIAAIAADWDAVTIVGCVIAAVAGLLAIAELVAGSG